LRVFPISIATPLASSAVIAPETTPAEFIRKIVLLARKPQKKVSGKLVLVDSGKGGIGVTTIAVGLAEALAEREQKVTLVDLDTETQDLSRFVQARPFINENLQAILEGSKPLTQESVNECLVNLFDDTGRVNCLPPIAECDMWYEAKSKYHRNFLSILEILDATRSVVIVDVSSLRGALLRHLYRAADKVVYVLNNDAATLYAAVDRLHRLRNFLSPESQICILENASLKHGLPPSLLRKEFLRAAQLEDSAWLTDSVPFCKFGYRWPGSGASIYSQGSEKIRSSLTVLAKQIGLIEDQLTNSLMSNWSFSKSLLSRKKVGSKDTSLRLLEDKEETKKLPAPESIKDTENLILEEDLTTPAQIEAA
jgi:MinD-like ATPase involved in chromosome partitioning or flagellar assembly